LKEKVAGGECIHEDRRAKAVWPEQLEVPIKTKKNEKVTDNHDNSKSLGLVDDTRSITKGAKPPRLFERKV